MQAHETSLLTLLAGQFQFLIPIFQRDYSWTEAECKRLISDIVDVADGPEGAIHFMGPVVWGSSNVGDAVISQRLVIDGQQRLRHQIEGEATGIKASRLKEIPVPIPPVAEQHRIVAKVDQLMALCDRLKADLAAALRQQATLAETLIESALEAA